MWSKICQTRQQLPDSGHPPPTQTPYPSTCRVCRVSRSWTRVLTMHKVKYSSPAWCKANTTTFTWTLNPALKFSWIAWRGSRSRRGHSRAQKWQMRARLNQVLRAMAVVPLLGRLTFKEQTLGQLTSTEWRTKIWRASLMTQWKAALLAVQISISSASSWSQRRISRPVIARFYRTFHLFSLFITSHPASDWLWT